MKIIRADHLGMCFGVRDAISLATNLASTEPITILGDLVHNPKVLQRLDRHGIRSVKESENLDTSTVMITAHGSSRRGIETLIQQGHRVIEATCPLVHLAHQAIQSLVGEGYHPVVIGRANHVEVRGMTGDLMAFDVILTESDVNALPPRKRFGVVAQTTQPVDRVRHLVARLRDRFPASEVRFVDTVCQPTKQRQHAAEELAHRCDVVVVVGGNHSNNTHELVKTCQFECPRVHQVESAHDLRSEWFEPEDTVGVTAGTSTPDDSIVEVEAWLRGVACSGNALSKSPVTAAKAVW